MSKRKPMYAAVYLVLIRDEQILLLRRANTGYKDGFYSLPAGHIDGGEAATAAMLREAREEIGITLTVEALTFVHVLHRHSDDGLEYHDYYFSAETTQQPRNMEPHKCDDLSWFPLANLPDNMVPAVRQAIDAIQRGSPYGEYGWHR